MSPRQLPALTVALAVTSLLAASATLAILGTVAAHIVTHTAIGDFLAYYTAGYLVRTGQGVHLYDPRVLEATERLLFPGHFNEPAGYPLPVFAAWLFATLSKLSFSAAYIAFISIMAAALAGLLFVFNQLLAGVPKGQRALFLGCAALALPTLATIVFGQVDFIALYGLLAGYILLRSERRTLAGIALCLVLIKPQLLVGIGLYLLVKREWRAIGSLAAVGVPLLVVPALLTSPSTLLGNVHEILTHDTRALAAAHLDVNANWQGFIASVTGSDRLIYWGPGFAVIAAGAIAVAGSRWRRGLSFNRDYSIAVLLPLLVSPHVHTQNLIVVLLPAALALREYLVPASTAETRQRATNAMLLGFTLLFALPFVAIQGLSVTGFFLLAGYLAVAYRWPRTETAAAPRAEYDAPSRIAA
jgi:hypothetical protein